MATVQTPYQHIVLDDGGVPLIADTTMKVVELVTSHQAYGWSPEELAFQYPYLSMGQIHSALAYYWDHQEERDADMARRMADVEEMRRRTPEAPVVARLRRLRACKSALL